MNERHRTFNRPDTTEAWAVWHGLDLTSVNSRCKTWLNSNFSTLGLLYMESLIPSETEAVLSIFLLLQS
jgi:hypothetical protein